MKWRGIIFLLLLSWQVKAQEKSSEVKEIKINYVNENLLKYVGPFWKSDIGQPCKIIFRDSTMLVKDNLFQILNRSKDNLKFLIFDVFYHSYAKLNMQNGFGYMYLVDLSDNKLNLYICNGYRYEMSRKHIDLNIDTITNKTLVIKGQ
jgi:hypothetical protein